MNRGRKPGSGEYDSQIRVRAPKDTIEQLKTISTLTGLSVSKTVRTLIEDYISKFEVKQFKKSYTEQLQKRNAWNGKV